MIDDMLYLCVKSDKKICRFLDICKAIVTFLPDLYGAGRSGGHPLLYPSPPEACGAKCDACDMHSLSGASEWMTQLGELCWLCRRRA